MPYDDDLDSEETILGMRKELDFEKLRKEIELMLTNGRHIVLATSSDDRITARTVSFGNDGFNIYFMSWDHNKKIRQLKKNSRVALCMDNLQIEGEAIIR